MGDISLMLSGIKLTIPLSPLNHSGLIQLSRSPSFSHIPCKNRKESAVLVWGWRGIIHYIWKQRHQLPPALSAQLWEELIVPELKSSSSSLLWDMVEALAMMTADDDVKPIRNYMQTQWKWTVLLQDFDLASTNICWMQNFGFFSLKFD